jgi:hypothetical protein
MYGYYVFPKPSVPCFPTAADPADRSCRYLVSPLPCQAWHGYMITSAHRVEVEVGADGHASAPLSGAAAAAPPAGAAHSNWGVPITVLTSMNNAPWCVVRKSLLYPPIELHGHRDSAWRVIKCVPLVTDFMVSVHSSTKVRTRFAPSQVKINVILNRFS